MFFGADTMRIPELDEVAHRFDAIDLALLPINGLTIRPLLNKQVVMNAADAAELTAVLRPRLVVPIHYAFTAGPLRERLLLKLDRRTTPFVDACADRAPDSTVHILAPGEPLDLCTSRRRPVNAEPELRPTRRQPETAPAPCA